MNKERLGRIAAVVIVMLLMIPVVLVMTWGLVVVGLDLIKTPYPPAETNVGPVGTETLFMASATIMALSVFGSVLSMRMQNRSKIPSLGWLVKICTVPPIVALIFIQSLFMQALVLGVDIYQISLGFTPILWWIQGTMICLIVISIFVFVANAYSFNQKVGWG